MMKREELEEFIDCELTNIRGDDGILNARIAKGGEGLEDMEYAAIIGKCLSDIYSGMERILREILKARNVRIHKGPSWHKEILGEALKDGIITEELLAILREYLGFRHIFSNNYGFQLSLEKTGRLVENLPATIRNFETAINLFLSKRFDA